MKQVRALLTDPEITVEDVARRLGVGSFRLLEFQYAQKCKNVKNRAIGFRYCLAAQYAIAIAPYAFFDFINLRFLTVRLGQYAGVIALRRNTLSLLRPMFFLILLICDF
ncbi:MAG: hypothetical protein PHW13_10280 [Methylococcales bacterium]|nr:hypothetical protein [Methylococcales bacterium]